MSAAVEAAIEDIPSAGFSLLDYSIEADFSGARHYARQVVELMLKTKLGKHTVLNVNIPAKALELLKGIKLCRQAYAKYEENYVQRNDPHGRQYYWLTGEFQNFDKGKDTDVWALANNFVSVVPVQYDLTHTVYLKQLSPNGKNDFYKRQFKTRTCIRTGRTPGRTYFSLLLFVPLFHIVGIFRFLYS